LPLSRGKLKLRYRAISIASVAAAAAPGGGGRAVVVVAVAASANIHHRDSNVVFAPVERDMSRTSRSSSGPVECQSGMTLSMTCKSIGLASI
jgi:hypothetical protein